MRRTPAKTAGSLHLGQLKQLSTLPPHHQSSATCATLRCIRVPRRSVPTPDEKYEKYKFDTIADNENLNVSPKAAAQRRSSISPPRGFRVTTALQQFLHRQSGGNGIAIGFHKAPVLIQPCCRLSIPHPCGRPGNSQDKMAGLLHRTDLTVWTTAGCGSPSATVRC